MRRSPPVLAPLLPQPAVQAVVMAMAALAVLGLSAWLVSHDTRAWPSVLAVPLAAAWSWREAAVLPRRLRWDGQAWWLAESNRHAETSERAVQLDVLIDLDGWLLLRATPGPYWLPLSKRQQPQWGALRATLHAAPSSGRSP